MTTAVTSTCACSGFTVTVEFPNSELPMNRALCLCNNCRRVSGSCGWSSILVPRGQMFDPALFKTTAYETSKGVARHFCSTCGAHTFTMVERGQTVCVFNTGLWDRTEGLIKWTGCKWVNDTLDGGISVWFKDIKRADGTQEALKRWACWDLKDGEFVPEGSLMTLPKKGEMPPKDDKLKAGCHCGAVKFYITRPDEASKEVHSPFPDLMVPYHSHSSENPKNETWWLRENGSKYLAGTCACTSCRLATGCEIQPWAFVPKCNIFQEDGTPLDFAMGTLKSYQSSKGVLREFCGVCGATIFWHCEERPELIDVSVGVLDPEQGARVESWLDWWTDRVSFEELALSKDLVASLGDGLKKWKEEKNIM
ncbi:Mss4-like protein [Rhexocercosporidium sp. MPI-PUGE-AT-0058]|nr:Mss4-like protein [Rhexocercosporidium sp. MPI-PUGE-AT-0058]